MKKTILTFLAVLVVVGLAAVFRFYDLQNFPAGLFPDEAANGEDALLILNGDIRPFYPRGNGREALFFYLQAVSIWWFGIGVWQMHLVSAVIGVATVLAAYFATRVWFGRLAGLFAALFLATNHWHVTLSRTGFRAIQIPLFIALFTAFVGYAILSVKKGKIGRSYFYAALAGAAWAGGFYTYIAYRMMFFIVAGVIVLLGLAALHPKIGFPHFRRYGRHMLVGILAVVLVLLPLAWYFWQHPQEIVGRAGQVSIFSPDLQKEVGGGTLLGAFEYSLRETVLSFFAGQGDLNWRHNVAGFPLLNPLVAVLFLLGLAWSIRGFFTVVYKMMRGQEVHLGMIYTYVLLLLFGMIVPVVTTAEGMPHGLRSAGLIIPIFMLAGVAAAVVWHWLKRGNLIAKGANGALAGLIIAGMFYDSALYFLIARHDTEAYYAYRGDLTVVAEYLNSCSMCGLPGWPNPYLALDKFSLQTVHFLTSVTAHDYVIGDNSHPDEGRHKWRQIDPPASRNLVLAPGEQIIFTQSTMNESELFASANPDAQLVESRKNQFGQEIMRVYRLATPAVEEAINNSETNFDLDAQ